MEYSLREGRTIIGRADELPVDVDLEQQETQDRIWVSRQHARIDCVRGQLTITDLDSTNGTFVNRSQLAPGRVYQLRPGDLLQIGTVRLQVLS
jgi:pSer/pThr/pTyr-binding forkhead associated (FHA) protein